MYKHTYIRAFLNLFYPSQLSNSVVWIFPDQSLPAEGISQAMSQSGLGQSQDTGQTRPPVILSNLDWPVQWWPV